MFKIYLKALGLLIGVLCVVGCGPWDKYKSDAEVTKKDVYSGLYFQQVGACEKSKIQYRYLSTVKEIGVTRNTWGYPVRANLRVMLFENGSFLARYDEKEVTRSGKFKLKKPIVRHKIIRESTVLLPSSVILEGLGEGSPVTHGRKTSLYLVFRSNIETPGLIGKAIRLEPKVFDKPISSEFLKVCESGVRKNKKIN